MKDKNFRSEYFKTMTQLATAGFGLVAALAWNDVIQTFISRIVPVGDGFWSKLIYALVVTFLAVMITYYLGRLTQKAVQQEEKQSKGDK